jgi:hypothetical protein
MTKPAPRNMQVRFAEDLLQRIEQFRQRQLVRPSLSETLRHLLERGLDAAEEEPSGAAGGPILRRPRK